MPDTTLRDLVLKRLDADTKPEDAWSALVLAALESPEELESLLEGPLSPRAPSAASGARDPRRKSRRRPRPQESPSSAPSPSKASAASARRRRSTSPPAPASPSSSAATAPASPASPRPSSCSSPATPTAGRTARKVWRDGWRNLHHPKAAIEAEFALEGEKGTCTVAARVGGRRRPRRRRPPGRRSTASRAPARTPSAGTTPLTTYRPFLSYNELGSMLDEGPSKLYDALSTILGLDDLVDAQTALAAGAHHARQGAEGRRQGAQGAPRPARDDRRRARPRAAAALARKDWGLDELEAVLAGARRAASETAASTLLQRLAVLPAPDEAAIAAVRRRPCERRAERQAQAGPDPGREVGRPREPPRPRPPLPPSPRRRRLPRVRPEGRARQGLAPAEGPGSRNPEADRKGSERSPASHEGQGQRSPKAPGHRPGDSSRRPHVAGLDDLAEARPRAMPSARSRPRARNPQRPQPTWPTPSKAPRPSWSSALTN